MFTELAYHEHDDAWRPPAQYGGRAKEAWTHEL